MGKACLSKGKERWEAEREGMEGKEEGRKRLEMKG